jgi:cytochrome d ubiquinol oxidase subunit II
LPGAGRGTESTWYSFTFWLCSASVVAIVSTFDIRDRLERNVASLYWAVIFPLLGALARVGVLVGARNQRDGWPFAMTSLFFLMAFITLAEMFWPYMIPYSITVTNAAAPAQSLEFMFYAGVVVLPVILIYSAVVYWVFRGKLRDRSEPRTASR